MPVTVTSTSASICDLANNTDIERPDHIGLNIAKSDAH